MDQQVEQSENLVRRCATMTVHRRLLDQHPDYRRRREELENGIQQRKLLARTLRTGTAVIPVVIHVVYNNLIENLSHEQIISQINVLNQDFAGLNSDQTSVPEVWTSIIGSAQIKFKLADRDPMGAPSSGITRTATSVDAFDDDDKVKFSRNGGVDAWPCDRYLNLWVCHLRFILGYAQFPGGPTETDGVVIDYRAFGTLGTAELPFNLGRTVTHEIGHWLNLFHIWGDDGTGCTGTDQVDDTPNQGGPNTGVPNFPHISCDNGPDGDLFVNFMDYVDDRCMVMFSTGQVERMHAALDVARPTFTESMPMPVDPAQLITWSHTDLNVVNGAVDAVSDPVAISLSGGGWCVFYRGVDGHIHLLRSG